MGLLDRLRAAAPATTPAPSGLILPPPPAPVVPKAGIAAMLARRAEQNTPVGETEIKRICSLPITDELEPNEVEAIQRVEILAPAYEAGFRLHNVQILSLLAWDMTGGLLGAIGVGWGKCVAGDTEVYDAELGRRRADEPGFLKTIAQKDGKLQIAEAAAMPSGAKPVVRLALRGGQAVTLSTDHPVLTGRGWVAAAALNPATDLVAVPCTAPEPPKPIEISDDELKVVAYLMADGCTVVNTPAFTNETPEILEEFERVVTAIGVPHKGWKRVGVKVVGKRGKATTLSARGISWLPKKHGIDCLSIHKRLPANFYNLPRRQVALFLNRFWGCDGYVGEDKLEVALGSEGLIDDLRFLLLRLGVTARKYFKVAKCNGKTFDAWRLVVAGKTNVLRFLAAVGPVIGKQKQSEQLRERTERLTANTNVDVVPIGREEVKQIADETGWPRSALRDRLHATAGQWIGREAFAAWVRESGYSGKFAWLATSDLLWDRIASVSDAGFQRVYDLGVPGFENFVGNGIVLHNSLLVFMLAERAWRRGYRRIVAFVPSAGYSQFTERDIAFARPRVKITIPIYGLGNRTPGMRRTMVKSGRPGLYVIPYSLLSTQDTSDLLAELKPEVLLNDEAHQLRGKWSAKTKRWLRVVEDFQPKCAAFSGTITVRGLKDYAHIIGPCLKEKSPLPLDAQTLEEWANVLDPGKFETISKGAGAPLLPLVDWAQRHFPNETFSETVAGFRKAFKHRLTTAPGVVSSGDAEIGVSLYICNVPVPNPEQRPGWDDLKRHMDNIEDHMVTPNGDMLQVALQKWGWLHQLSAGFYYRLRWPTPQQFAERKKISLERATAMLEQAIAQHEAQNAYNAMLAKWLKEHAKPKLDTPRFVGLSMLRHGADEVGEDLYGAWQYAKDLEFEGMPERDEDTVRVCDYKVQHAVEWASTLPKGEGGIIWYHYDALGQWIYEEVYKAVGPKALHCPAGEPSNLAIRDPNNAGRVVIASIQAHGESKQLEHFWNQLIVQFPRGSKGAEQLLGRCHRNGQTRDELHVHTCHTTEFDKQNLGACINDTIYVASTTGTRPKLVIANHDPEPEVYRPELLEARGFETQRLNAEQRRMLEERFGSLRG